MVQQIGETRDAIIEDDEKHIQEILSANKNRLDPYWIILFAKVTDNTVEGKPVIAKHIQALGYKPPSMMGMFTAEVNNRLGTIHWEINMHQTGFDFDKVPGLNCREGDKETFVETTTIADAYITH